MNDLDSRYSEQTIHFLQICMVLDPRFKFKYVLDQDTKESLKQIVTDEMISNHLSAKDTTTAPLRNTNPIEMPPKKVYKTVWGRIFGEQQAAETPSSAETELYSDIAKRELEITSFIHYQMLSLLLYSGGSYTRKPTQVCQNLH